jgi:flavin-dependent dehydrogenase
LNSRFDGFRFDNFFLVGEAAGMVLKKTGEGISFAVISGREIGKRIANHNYAPTRLHDIIAVKKRQDRLFELFENYFAHWTIIYKSYMYVKSITWVRNCIDTDSFFFPQRE